MKLSACCLWLKAIITATVLIFAQAQALALTVAKSDILLHIVSQCVDPSKENYCSNCMLPRRDASCSGVTECKQTNEVWALNTQYVAIRDIKMCGCPTDFIHGLAMPRDIVTGVEDSNRQEGIWQFAWDIGLERIEIESLALVVNPKSQRSQNQLHIHILRLDPKARATFEQYLPVYAENLENVWSIAAANAKSKGLDDYGVLVTKALSGKFIVLVSPNSPEAAFTTWKCN